MKRFLVLLLLLVSLVGCGMNSPNPAAPDLQPLAKSNAAQTYDMLSWMTMQSQLSAGHHMAGTANPLYTSRSGTRFYWTKNAAGFPWDIQLFDSKYVYLWVTELDWQNPRTFKVFHSA